MSAPPLRVLSLACLLAASCATGRAFASDDDILPREFPFLADESHEGSRSIGDTSGGFLVGARRLDESERLAILPKQRERDLAYGSDELLAALDEASRVLFASTRTKLWIGNVARRYGGDIPWSVSHNSGRDADIAFAYLDAAGKPADPPDLVPLDMLGTAPSFGLRFDVARTWLIVKSLLESKHASVQYLFISVPLKTQLLTHARRVGESTALVMKAADVLRQPGGSGAHDDHLHVRVYCSERDVLAGCVDTGVEHPWHENHGQAKAQRIEAIVARLADPTAVERERALERLVLLDARAEFERMTERLTDPEPGVRRAAVDAVRAFGCESDAVKLEAMWRNERDVTVRIAILAAAAALGGEPSGTLLVTAVGHPEREPTEFDRAVEAYRAWALPADAAVAARVFGLAPMAGRPSSPLDALLAPPWPVDHTWLDPLAADRALGLAVQLAAVDAAARSERLEPLEALSHLVGSSEVPLRAAADRALAFATNLPPELPTTPSPVSAARHWERRVGRQVHLPRDTLLVAGFRAAGFSIPELKPRYGWELVRAIASHDHLSFNAQRTLMRLFDHRPPSLAWSKEDACLHWLRWLDGTRTAHHLPPASDDLQRACAMRRR